MILKSRKGQGLSIRTLVIIALAVFVIFLIIGFVTSGFGSFAEQFGATKGETKDTATVKCNQAYSSYVAQGKPPVEHDSRWDKELCQPRTDLDLNEDGVKDSADVYSCIGDNAVLSASQHLGAGCPTFECSGGGLDILTCRGECYNGYKKCNKKDWCDTMCRVQIIGGGSSDCIPQPGVTCKNIKDPAICELASEVGCTLEWVPG